MNQIKTLRKMILSKMIFCKKAVQKEIIKRSRMGAICVFVLFGSSSQAQLHNVPLEDINSGSIEVGFPQLSFDGVNHITNAGDGSNRVFLVNRDGFIYSFVAPPDMKDWGRVGMKDVSLFLDLSEYVSKNHIEEGLFGLAFDPDYSTNKTLYVSYTVSPLKNTARGLLADPKDCKTGHAPLYVLSRIRVNDSGKTASGEPEEILKVAKTASDHSGGALSFGPDGFLYVGLGDGGRQNDPFHRAQDLRWLNGKIIRIDVSGVEGGYEIPSGNPYSGSAKCFDSQHYGSRAKTASQPHHSACYAKAAPGAAACPEIFAVGLRNPWKMNFDSSGNLWIGDVGQDSWEEINVIPADNGIPRAKMNFGWSVKEGRSTHNSNASYQGKQNFDHPYYSFNHHTANDISIIGGMVYEGSINEFKNKYIFGDWWSGRILSIPVPNSFDQGTEAKRTELGTVRGVVGFGQTESKELLWISLNENSSIYTLKGSDPQAVSPSKYAWNIPEKLSQLGLFRDLKSLRPRVGLIEYEVNAPLWSDNAKKTRWVYIPDSQKIYLPKSSSTGRYSAELPWSYPVGSIFIKHFELPLNYSSEDHSETKRLETRLLVRQYDGWRGYTYRWNQWDTEAFLLGGQAYPEETMTDQFSVTNAMGQKFQQQWIYPSRNQCFQCHSSENNFVLGFNSPQLNKDQQWHRLVEKEIFADSKMVSLVTDTKVSGKIIGVDWISDHDLGALANFDSLYPDESYYGSNYEHLARSYLAANCSHCHQPGKITNVPYLDLRYSREGQSLRAMNAIGAPAHRGDVGSSSGQLIHPGQPTESVILRRMAMRRSSHENSMVSLVYGVTDQNWHGSGSDQMPPLATDFIHPAALNVVEKWVRSLEGHQNTFSGYVESREIEFTDLYRKLNLSSVLLHDNGNAKIYWNGVNSIDSLPDFAHIKPIFFQFLLINGLCKLKPNDGDTDFILIRPTTFRADEHDEYFAFQLHSPSVTAELFDESDEEKRNLLGNSMQCLYDLDKRYQKSPMANLIKNFNQTMVANAVKLKTKYTKVKRYIEDGGWFYVKKKHFKVGFEYNPYDSN